MQNEKEELSLEELEEVATEILEEHIEAFKELAKWLNWQKKMF